MANYTYNYNGTTGSDGSTQIYVVPSYCNSITITAYGSNSVDGGYGGQAYGVLSVIPGTTYYINVGGQGYHYNSGGNWYAPGGYSGGGSGGPMEGNTAGSPGGGMTWISPNNSFDSSVILVAGGAAAGSTMYGYGGGSSGGSGQSSSGGAGGGGTQSNGGAGGAGSGAASGSSGSSGAGGNGAYPGLGNLGTPSAGGGGGYYGGGGGGSVHNGVPGTGGGGSSYLSSSLSGSYTTAGVNNGAGSLMLSESVFNLSISVVDTEVENDITWLSGNLKLIDINYEQTESTQDFAGLHRQLVAVDLPIQVGTSSYKWLTSTLYSAQNQFTVRPYITCSIIDETLLVNQQIYNTPSNSTVGGFSGDAVIAPDGSILAIGRDNAGALRFAQITDGTQISQWNQILNGTGGIVIAISGGGNWEWNNPTYSTNAFHLNASIAVSEYINGTYTIDIYYWYVSGGDFQIGRSRSTNGGNSFTNYSDVAIATIASSSLAIQVEAGQPIYNPLTGNISATVFYLGNNTIYYNYTANGTSFSGSLAESWTNFNPTYIEPDWVLHSFDVEYINGISYIVFSGYESIISSTNLGFLTSSSTQNSFFGNYGLYMTKLLQFSDSDSNPPTPIFTEPIQILSFNSSSPTNINQALYPSLNYDGEYLWLTFRLDSTTSVSETSIASATTNYYTCRSLDLKNFDYPTIVLDVNGNSIIAPSTSTTYYNGVCKYSFVGNQNGYYYFWGDGALWQFIQNNVVANVSNSILSYTVTDQSGGASSINLTIDNSNGQWFGSTPTLPGYQAICKNGTTNLNSKIYLQQGYYTSIGLETVPRNVFYITNITQNVSSNTNDLVIVGQDWNKLLSVTQTAFTYNFQGPDMYYDPFNTTTVPSWTQSVGTWIATPRSGAMENIFAPYSTYTVNSNSSSNTYTTALSSSTLATLSGFSIRHPEITLNASVYIPTGMASNSSIDFYPWYLNSTNWIKVSLLYSSSNTVTLSINGLYNNVSQATPGNISSGATLTTTGSYYPVFIRLYDYGTSIDVMVGTAVDENTVDAFSAVAGTSTGLQYSGLVGIPGGPYSPLYNALTPGQLATIAIGTTGNINTGSSNVPTNAPIWTAFYNLKFTQNTYSQSVGELTESLGTLAHIFNYFPEQDFIQDLYDSTQWNTSGSASFPNRTLSLSDGAFALQNNKQYTDGQIEFQAKVSVSTLSENFGFDFVFRSTFSNNLTNCYKIRIMNSSNNSTGYIVKVSLVESSTTGGSFTDVPLYSSIIPDLIGGTLSGGGTPITYSGSNNLNIDLTQLNSYKIAFNKGWIYVFINGVEVFSWYDNNATSTFSTGYWGFSTVNTGANYDNAFSSNQIVTIQNIKFPTFWNQNNAFSLNPGDDLTSAIQQNLQTYYGWFFSDLGGRFKFIVLRSTDSLSYYYGNGAQNYLLYNTSNNSSDTQYYNQVLVVGDGVSYLATNGSSVGSNGILREEVIVDYTITTLSAATTRANNELVNIAKYGIQPAPTLQINVGSELFDVVNIQDNSTGNASNLEGNYRLYTETFTIDNQSNYNLQLGAGNL